MPDQRRRFLDWLLEQEGRTCLWASKGPLVFDCSGLVTCGYLAVGQPDWRQTHNTDGLWNDLQPTQSPEPGDLVLYGGTKPKDVEHVMVWWGDGRVFGACGASASVPTLELAKMKGAMVRFRQLCYRSDLRGFRRSPFLPLPVPSSV